MLHVADIPLVLAIVVGLPWRALHAMRRLRALSDADAAALRPALYARAILSQWTLVALVGVAWALLHRDARELGLELRPTGGLAGVLAGAFTIVLIVLRQRPAAARDPELAERLRNRLEAVRGILPHDDPEFVRFVPLAVTAGICEEILFRGYLVWVLAHAMPVPAAYALSSAIFGLGHLYQGPRGVVMTAVAGAFFAAVVAVSGSLYPAMLLHALMDLHAGDMARTVFRPAAVRA
jgi:membrane protease YdiL (CAAX protease family)